MNIKAKSLSAFAYTGAVTLKLKINDKTTTINAHNTGLDALFMLLSKALAGYDTRENRPAYIDLRYEDSGTWISCLNRKVSLSANSYAYDSQNARWVTRLSAVISNEQLTQNISTMSGVPFRLYLVDISSTAIDLAWLSISQTDLANIVPGTQALVEWDMFVENNA